MKPVIFMKRYGILCLMFFLLTGCSFTDKTDVSMNEYQKIQEKLIQHHDLDESYPFTIQLVYNQIDENYRYLIIDDPQIDMYAIQAMTYCSLEIDDIQPNIGFFEEEKYHLKPNYVDKSEGYYKGIRLSSMTSQEETVYLYISYYTDKNCQQKVEKYIEVNIN